MNDRKNLSIKAGLSALSSWAALGWVFILALARVWDGPADSGLGALRAAELDVPALLAFGLPALALLLLGRAPRWAGFAGLATMILAGTLLLKWGVGLEGAELLPERGVSALGRFTLGGWLFGAGLACWALGLVSTPGLSAALLAVTALGMALGAACAFVLSCWLIFGEQPGSAVLLASPTLVAALLLTLALLQAVWAQVGLRSRLAPEEGYRWMFARQLTLLLSSCTLAGLAAAALVSAHTAELLTDGLLSRATRQAAALERYVGRSAAMVQALHERSERTDAALLTRELGRLADRVQLASSAQDVARQGWAAAVPVLRSAEFEAGLLADGGLRIDLAARGARGPLFVQLHTRQVPGLFSEEDPQQFTALQLICTAREVSDRLDCADIVAPRGGAARPGGERYAVQAPGWRHHGAGLIEIHGPFGGRTLAAFAPVGELGGQLLLRVNAANLFRALGRPLLQAMLLLTGLALLGAAWSYWRQLPGTRELYLSRAQAEATMRHLPLATLVLDEQLLVLQANPAAERLLGAPAAAALPGRPVADLLPAWRASQDGGMPERLRLEARDPSGGALPVEVEVASFTESGRRRHLLMLRDLRPELRDAQDLQRWRTVFDDAGWGMAIASADAESLLELVNPAYARLLGQLPAELVGKPMRACVAPSSWEALAQLRGAAERDGSVQAQLRHRHRDGRELPTLLSLTAVRDEQGAVTHFVASVQDISALKHAEDQATRHARHLRAVLDALPVGVWIGDTQGLVQQTNKAAQRLWGQAGESGAEGPSAAAPWWSRDRLPGLIDHDSLMRRATILRRSVDSGLMDLELPGGGRRTVLTTASPILDADGSTIGAIAIDEDLTVLRRGEIAVRQAHDLLERILEACAVGIALSDARGRVQRRNLAWNLLIGPTADADVLDATLEAGDNLHQRDLIARVARGELPSYVGEHRMRRASGASGWTMLVVSRLPSAPAEGAQVLVQVLDVDERRRSGDEIAGSQLRLAAAQKLARMGDWRWHVAQDCVSCSDEMLGMLGVAVPAEGGLNRERFFQLVHPEERESFGAAVDRALLSMGRLDQDLRLLRPDGVELIVHVHGVAQRTPEGMMMAGTLQDVTDRKRIESELRESRERLRELVAYEGELIEDERKRIAREVHDELGQLLTALRLDLSMLQSQLPQGAAALQRLEQMRETMGTMTDVVRHIASNLRPAALDLGLTAAIEWLAEDFSLRWETRCELQLPRDHEPELTEAAALALFRAVQESLTNIAKHARASRVSIAMRQEGGTLQLRIGDDGQGFDPAEVAARRGGGLGLLGMRERMHAIGAQFAIQTGATGTTVEIDYKIVRSTQS